MAGHKPSRFELTKRETSESTVIASFKLSIKSETL